MNCRWSIFVGACLAWCCGPAQAAAPWAAQLKQELSLFGSRERASLGVYVHDVDSGVSVSHQADQTWYLASMVKVAVAITVLRGIEAGRYDLDTTLTLRASDFVDGAGATNQHPVGTPLSVRFLLEQMIVYSDNTATDMLIGLTGAAEVNAVVESLVPDGLRRITTLGEIRRSIYALLAPNVERLSGHDLLLLRRAGSDAELVKLLRHLVKAPAAPASASASAPAPTLNSAFDSYYASGVNSGRLDAHAQLLLRLIQGDALGPRSTDYLLGLMERIATGDRRIKAGLPAMVRFAHKTGTQRRRACDGGIARWKQHGQTRHALIVACVRDAPSLERAESLLLQLGRAVCSSGLFSDGVNGAPICPVAEAVPARTPGAPAAAGVR